MILEGFIQFENDIPVTIECLGERFPINIGGVDGFLAMPRMFEGFYEVNDRKLGPLRVPNYNGSIDYVENLDWGKVYNSPLGDSYIKGFCIVFPDIEKLEFEEKGQNIFNNLAEWRNTLIENISVRRHTDFRGKRRLILMGGGDGTGEYGLFRKMSWPDKYFRPKSNDMGAIVINVARTFVFDKISFQQILDDTSQINKPLLPFYFFLDAERAKFEKNYRKSLLDCATAVELCFSLVLVNLLPPPNKLNKYNSLKQKRKVLNDLEITLPFNENEYKNGLDNIRNRVIHGGYIPSKEEVSKAVIITENTLYELLPKKHEI